MQTRLRVAVYSLSQHSYLSDHPSGVLSTDRTVSITRGLRSLKGLLVMFSHSNQTSYSGNSISATRMCQSLLPNTNYANATLPVLGRLEALQPSTKCISPLPLKPSLCIALPAPATSTKITSDLSSVSTQSASGTVAGQSTTSLSSLTGLSVTLQTASMTLINSGPPSGPPTTSSAQSNSSPGMQQTTAVSKGIGNGPTITTEVSLPWGSTFTNELTTLEGSPTRTLPSPSGTPLVLHIANVHAHIIGVVVGIIAAAFAVIFFVVCMRKRRIFWQSCHKTGDIPKGEVTERSTRFTGSDLLRAFHRQSR